MFEVEIEALASAWLPSAVARATHPRRLAVLFGENVAGRDHSGLVLDYFGINDVLVLEDQSFEVFFPLRQGQVAHHRSLDRIPLARLPAPHLVRGS